MELSHSVRKRFVKDNGLPFQVVQSPYFEYYIDELDGYFDTKNKYKNLVDVVEQLGGEEQFFSEVSRIKDSIVNGIKATEVYENLAKDRLEEFNVQSNVKQQNIYNFENADKTFISIDLAKANFNVLRSINPALVLDTKNYDELISRETDSEYFKKSKYLRQVIFGNLLPKKQQKIQKWIMSKIINVLHQNVGVEMEDFISASSDEVVFAVSDTDVGMFRDMVERKLSESEELNHIHSWTKVEAFTLKSIGGKKFFVKEKTNGGVEFKGIPAHFFMQAFKKYLGREINKEDKTFYHDGFLATFDQDVFD